MNGPCGSLSEITPKKLKDQTVQSLCKSIFVEKDSTDCHHQVICLVFDKSSESTVMPSNVLFSPTNSQRYSVCNKTEISSNPLTREAGTRDFNGLFVTKIHCVKM